MPILGPEMTTADPTCTWADARPAPREPAALVEARQNMRLAWDNLNLVIDEPYDEYDPDSHERHYRRIHEAEEAANEMETRYKREWRLWDEEKARRLAGLEAAPAWMIGNVEFRVPEMMEDQNRYSVMGGYYPDDCGECAGCGNPSYGGGLCSHCNDQINKLIQKGNMEG